jgi:Ino eighty subunit 1
MAPTVSKSQEPPKDEPMYTATTTTTRRNANGSVSSVYSGNKIRHLKKEDGLPLWRKDIQYEFLKAVFEDDKPVFHKASDGTAGHTFADIYLDAMAKSSKCSKILKDKLLTERAAAVNMAMVCLLVNVGRMNTTLNCKLSDILSHHLLLNLLYSLSRNACATTYLPFDPFVTSSPRSKLL